MAGSRRDRAESWGLAALGFGGLAIALGVAAGCEQQSANRYEAQGIAAATDDARAGELLRPCRIVAIDDLPTEYAYPALDLSWEAPAEALVIDLSTGAIYVERRSQLPIECRDRYEDQAVILDD